MYFCQIPFWHVQVPYQLIKAHSYAYFCYSFIPYIIILEYIGRFSTIQRLCSQLRSFQLKQFSGKNRTTTAVYGSQLSNHITVEVISTQNLAATVACDSRLPKLPARKISKNCNNLQSQQLQILCIFYKTAS